MKRLFILVFSTVALIVLVNYLYYKNLYDRQIKYISELLDSQAQITGLSVDETNNGFLSDLNQIIYTEDFISFFSDNEKQKHAADRMKLFYSKYENFVTGIKFNDNNRNEYTLKKDNENAYGDWLEQSFILHAQGKIYGTEQLVQENRKFNYYLPVIDSKSNAVAGDIVVTVDFPKYFREIFSVFNIKKYQWQWVLSDSGEIVYSNYPGKIEYQQFQKITSGLEALSNGNIIHNVRIDDKKTEIISAFYSAQLLQRNFALVFSAPTAFFQKYIIRNSLFIVTGTLIAILVIIFLFWKYLGTQKEEMDRLKSSEKMLFRLIEEMPVGVIIHNKSREIIKANKVAADLYSYKSESEMQGKIFPETSSRNYSAMNGKLNPDQFIIIRKEIGEMVLFRKSIPVTFMGTDADMEILIDVTLLESARKNEAKANVAKSEFLARMSYEIRTPLNGIIGMTDVLSHYDLTPEVKEMILLLRRSTEVLLNIINDILDFSKIESGKMILDEVPFNLREEIIYCTDIAKTNISTGTVNLTSSVDSNLPESIIGDPFRLRQVLTNLLNHSVKNTEKGEISLECSLVSRKKGVLTIGFEIKDTGVAFDQSAIKKMFGDFVNIDAISVRNNDESSFGTILARQLVGLMGGELKAESPSGLDRDNGIKIFFTIITYSNERVVKRVPVENIRSMEQIKCLVITGSQGRDEEVLGFLHKSGMNVNITSYNKSTVNQLRANLNYPDERYNLVIIFDDRDFDGFEAAKSIWDNKLAQDFIILIISSNDRKGNYNNSISLGIDQYMVKPFGAGDLISAVKNYFPYLEELSVRIEADDIRKDIKILVVEDNKLNQKLIGTMLKSLGYSCDIADDGYAGFLQAKSKKYDLVFMDLMLPEMDGFEAAQRILRFDRTVVIVAFTADNLPETKKKAELAGIRDFVPKPVRTDDLRKVLARHFRK